MRVALLAALLVGLALAGCTGKDPQERLETGEEDPRRSVGGGGNKTEVPHDDVTIFDGPIDLVGPASQQIDAVVPDNVTVVTFSISSVDQKLLTSFHIDVAGCGAWDQGAGSTSVGNIALNGRLCDDAASGATKVTVSNTGLVQTTLKVTGQIPRLNATAPT